MKIKQILLLAISIISLFMAIYTLNAVNQVNIYFFHDPLCLHCQEEEIFLEELKAEYQSINVIVIDVTANDENQILFEKVKSAFDETSALTPYTVIGGVSLQGFNLQTKADIRSMIDRYSNTEYVDIVQKILNNESVFPSDFDSLDRDTVNLPIIGEVNIGEVSLLLGAIILGFIDGFNPCAMWILILLISVFLNAKNKKKAFFLGVIFLFASALVYFLIMMSWLVVAAQLSTIKLFRYLIGALAAIFGVYNFYIYFKNRNKDVGCEVTDETKRTKIMTKIKSIVTEKHFLIAAIGIIGLAFTVNLIELACSAGLPLLYTSILTFNNLSPVAYVGYVLIYVFFFLLDDLIIFSLAMITFRVTGISNRYTKYSHLIGGIIMFLIGIMLVFFPNLIMFN
jgi:thiol-disulfide isomerase/thioredoxin